MNEILGEGRFYIKTEHGDAELLFRIEGNKMTIYKTFTPVEERHKGLAKSLVEFAYEFAKRNNYIVIDECEFAASFDNKKDNSSPS